MEENGKGTLICRVLFFDVLIPLVRFCLLVWSIVNLFRFGNPWWAWCTIGAILAPGTLEVCYWLSVCCCDPEKRSSTSPWKWIAIFNPIFFPISTIVWHIYALLDVRMYHEYFPMFLVLNSLQSFTEAAAITLLQLVIITTTWNDEESTSDVVADSIYAISGSLNKREVTRYVQIASAILAVVGLAKDYSRHHFYELSGKEVIPPFWKSLKALLFYLAHISCRVPSLLLLALFFRHYFFIILLTLVTLNLAFSVCFLGRNFSKSIWTGFAAVLAPTCFVAKADVPTFSHAGKSFFKFYVANTVAFIIVTLGGHILADVYYGLGEAHLTSGLNEDILKFLMESIKKLPFVDIHCSPVGAGCIYILSTIGMISGLAEFFLLWIQYSCFPDFLGTNIPVIRSA